MRQEVKMKPGNLKIRGNEGGGDQLGPKQGVENHTNVEFSLRRESLDRRTRLSVNYCAGSILYCNFLLS
jgi:hypothetical protein